MVAQVRNLAEQKEDEQGAELAPAERSGRIRKQKERLGGDREPGACLLRSRHESDTE